MKATVRRAWPSTFPPFRPSVKAFRVVALPWPVFRENVRLGLIGFGRDIQVSRPHVDAFQIDDFFLPLGAQIL